MKIVVNVGRSRGTVTLEAPDHTALVMSDLVSGYPVEGGRWLDVAGFGALEVAEREHWQVTEEIEGYSNWWRVGCGFAGRLG